MHTTKPRTFYVAGKAVRDEPIVRAIHKKLIELGLELTYDWTKHSIPRPFATNREISAIRAKEMVAAITQADIFVAVANGGGTGLHIETGLALLLTYYNLHTHVFIVGMRSNSSIFYFLPGVRRLTSMRALIEAVKKIL